MLRGGYGPFQEAGSRRTTCSERATLAEAPEGSLPRLSTRAVSRYMVRALSRREGQAALEATGRHHARRLRRRKEDGGGMVQRGNGHGGAISEAPQRAEG